MGVICSAALILALAGQTRSWLPPKTSIDKEYVKTAKLLLGTHLGDPRRGKYMRVQIKLEGPRNDYFGFKAKSSAIFEVQGWLLPGEPKRAVLWDGLTYPVQRVIGPADLGRVKADFEATPFAPWRFQQGMGFHSDLLSARTITAPALWLLVGEVEAAELVWSYQLGHGVVDGLIKRYLAHAFYEVRNGNLEMAIGWLKRERDLRRVTRSEDLQVNNLRDQVAPLMKDLEERLAHQPKDVTKLAPGDPVRIREELASVRFFYAGFGNGPIDETIQDVVSRGAIAVPALLQLRSLDDRFTLASFPSRNFAGPVFAPISLAARFALELIWNEYPFVESKSNEDLAAMFERQRTLSTAERIVEILEDDTVPLGDATQAFWRLNSNNQWLTRTQKSSLRLESARMFTRITSAADSRAKKALADLDLPLGNPLHFAKTFLASYATWDYAEAAPHLHRLTTILLEELKSENQADKARWDAAVEGVRIGLRAGDPFAVESFGTLCLLGSVTEHWLPLIGCAVFAPNDPKVDQYLRAFLQRASLDSQDSRAWLTRLSKIKSYSWETVMAVRPFREWLVSCLANPSFEIARGGPVYLLSPMEYRVEFTAPRKGPEVIHLRVDDFCAQILDDKFETGLRFDVFANDEVRAKQRKSLSQWVAGLPNEALKQRGPRSPTGR